MDRWRSYRMSYRFNHLLAIIVIVLLLVAAMYVDVYLWPNHNLGLLEVLPVLIAATSLRPKEVYVVAGFAVALLVVDAILAQVALNYWALLLIAIAVYGYTLRLRRRGRR